MSADPTRQPDPAKRLSLLQRQILQLALENKQREERAFNQASGADVFYSEVFVQAFGFAAKKPPRRWPSSRIFSPREIGRQKYRSAVAALSRSALRLARRGLVTPVHSRYSTWSGISLTPEGVELARTIEDFPKINAIPAGKPKGTAAQEARPIRSILISYYGSQCQYCGAICADHKLEIEHIRPLSKGGNDVLENYTVACQWCNDRKRGLELPEPGISLLLARARQFAERIRAKQNSGTVNKVNSGLS